MTPQVQNTNSIVTLLLTKYYNWTYWRSDDLVKRQRRAARLFSKSSDLQCSSLDHKLILARAGLSSLSERRKAEQAVFAFKFRSGSLPMHIMDAFDHWLSKPQRSATLRSSSFFRLPRARKSCLKHSPLYLSLSTWNSLPLSAHNSLSSSALKSLLLADWLLNFLSFFRVCYVAGILLPPPLILACFGYWVE